MNQSWQNSIRAITNLGGNLNTAPMILKNILLNKNISKMRNFARNQRSMNIELPQSHSSQKISSNDTQQENFIHGYRVFKNHGNVKVNNSHDIDTEQFKKLSKRIPDIVGSKANY